MKSGQAELIDTYNPEEFRVDFQRINRNILIKKNFSYSRWGDGEWNCILKLKKTTQNCDGHKYFDSLGKALMNVLSSKPQYHLGLQPLAKKLYGKNIRRITKRHSLEWISSELFHKASIDGIFTEFMQKVKTRQCLLVGPEYLSILGFNMIEIPETDCWLTKDKTMQQIRKSVQKDMVVMFAAGMPSNIMINQLYDEYGCDCSFLDVGSVLDPYAGKITRKYHRQIIKRCSPVV